EGATLLKKMIMGGIAPRAAGEIMARLAHSLHAPGYQASLKTFRQWTLFSLRQLRNKNIATDVLDIVQRTIMDLPEDGVLCHGDLHADNILMTPNGPVAIDWV